ncbi:type I DNA topoisomerase [candidate division KSB1 bacterium]|nr:type I DNA topoisomerase [candidate division KSB1 bacterium]RQW02710.1 MAG: type I DNA topoisomerase [candidate division KSB1 bacterium]
MSKFLVIVESPAKAKTINKYLGPQYVVKSSVGHIRDLPVSAKVLKDKKKAAPIPKDASQAEKERLRKERAYSNLVRSMGIDPENGWKANYVILPDKYKILHELKKQAAVASEILLATDLDREGEAIAWHLMESIGGDVAKYRRVTFGEITKPAIEKAFAEPGELNMQRVHAQQTRRFLDRVVGYMVSPLLWKKIARGLSAGRVQSVAVRLIVEREREIHAFVPEEYWELFADLQARQPFRAKVVSYLGKKFEPKTRDDIDRALPELNKAVYTVLDRKITPTKQRPYAPFITSTLQQAASLRLGFSIKKTMMLAQRLYQAGHITYMRTDSRNISPVALNAVRDLIQKEYGDSYLPAKPNFYASSQSAQEAHEAIRPTNVAHTTAILRLEKDEAKIYDLIWRQFVASQMTPAEFDRTTITIKAGDYELRATGRVMRFDGWMRVLPPAKTADDEAILPEVKVGEELTLIGLDPVQHFTKPPARYTEASLVKELEKRGIGRPSTYASIISTIQERGYVQLVKRRFYAQKIGEIVTDRLVENFQKLMDYDFTADMEQDLDKIAAGQQEWRHTLDVFYADFKQTLGKAEKHMRLNHPVHVDVNCPACGMPMVVRTASTGTFLSCSGYEKPPNERCTHTINLVPGEEAMAVSDNEDEGSAEEILGKKRCPLCDTAMDSWLIDAKRRLHICGNSPDCTGTLIETGEFRIKGYDGPVVECEKCGSEMHLKTGRFGKFFACTGTNCKNTRKLMRNGQPAPPMADPVPMPELKCEKSDAYFLLREGLAGLFLAAHTFPKSRETKSPLVADLARHRQELDPKFYYLADAPQTDPDGNMAIIKWRRKERRQYLGSEKDGKPTKWTAGYVNGKWKWTK